MFIQVGFTLLEKIARALDASVPAAWATADEFYGSDQRLRRDLQGRGVGYVLAVAKSLYRANSSHGV